MRYGLTYFKFNQSRRQRVSLETGYQTVTVHRVCQSLHSNLLALFVMEWITTDTEWIATATELFFITLMKSFIKNDKNCAQRL